MKEAAYGEDTPSILKSHPTVKAMTEWVALKNGHREVYISDMLATVRSIIKICERNPHKRERRVTRKQICFLCEDMGERTCRDKRERCSKKLIKIL